MEYRMPTEDLPLPPENAPLPPEFSAAGEPRDLPDEEFNPQAVSAPVETDRHSRIKRLLMMPLAAAVTAVTLILSSFGVDPLGLDLFGTGGSSSVTPAAPASPISPTSPTSPAAPVETADSAFPNLSNLERNGYLGYLPAHDLTVNGRLNENYIAVVASDGVRTPVLYNNAGSEAVDGTIPGLSYDGVTNTLTMTNYDGPALDINMMGNGFKIRLVGDNRLDHLNLWGFYSGGSVTLIGSGSLTVNARQRYAVGIQMDAEWSETCLIVDNGVRLEVFGSPTASPDPGGGRNARGAVIVSDTTMDKAIYYMAPLTLTGGVRSAGIFGTDAYGNRADAYDFGSFRDYSVVDENGDPSMHVIFE